MEVQRVGRLLTTAEAAKRLRVHAATMRRWRLDDVGPRFLNVGSVYRYPEEYLEAWITEKLSEQAAA